MKGLIMKGKVSRQCMSITRNVWRERKSQARRCFINEGQSYKTVPIDRHLWRERRSQTRPNRTDVNRLPGLTPYHMLKPFQDSFHLRFVFPLTWLNWNDPDWDVCPAITGRVGWHVRSARRFALWVRPYTSSGVNSVMLTAWTAQWFWLAPSRNLFACLLIL